MPKAFYSQRVMIGSADAHVFNVVSPVDATVMQIIVDPPMMGVTQIEIPRGSIIIGRSPSAASDDHVSSADYISGAAVERMRLGADVACAQAIKVTVINPTLAPCSVGLLVVIK